jgi:hypothetical protein
MHICDSTGIQTVKYRHCTCERSASDAQQILDAGWLQETTGSNICETWALRAKLEKFGA